MVMVPWVMVADPEKRQRAQTVAAVCGAAHSLRQYNETPPRDDVQDSSSGHSLVGTRDVWSRAPLRKREFGVAADGAGAQPTDRNGGS